MKQSEDKSRRQNDILWKGMLEEVFDDLLRFVFPRADQIFDLKRGFEFLDKELGAMRPRPGRRSDTRFVDKLVKVFQRDGSEEWVLCHVEVQGVNDGRKLPSMYVRKYEGAEVTYKYNTLYLLDYEDRVLAADPNPFALVMLAAKKALLRGKNLDEILLKEKMAIAKLLIKREYSEAKTYGILSFLHNYVGFEKFETNCIFEGEIDILMGKTNTMGIIEQVRQMKLDAAREEGIEEGRLEEKTQVVKRLLTRGFSVRETIVIAGATTGFVNKVKATLKEK